MRGPCRKRQLRPCASVLRVARHAAELRVHKEHRVARHRHVADHDARRVRLRHRRKRVHPARNVLRHLVLVPQQLLALRTLSPLLPSSCSTSGMHAFDCTNLGNASLASARQRLLQPPRAPASPPHPTAAAHARGNARTSASPERPAEPPAASAAPPSARAARAERVVRRLSLQPRPKTEIDAG